MLTMEERKGLSQQKWLVFGAAAAVRLVLAIAFPELPDLLSGRVEISTPITSFKRLQEGLFLYNHGVSPYDGGIFHQAPLFLPLFSLLPGDRTFHLTSTLLYTILDIMSANALIQVSETQVASSSHYFTSPRADRRWSSIAVAASFLLNPLTLLTCLGRPTSAFATSFVMIALAKSCSGAAASSVFALAIASYISLHPVLLFPPLALLCYHRIQQKPSSDSEKPQSLTAFFIKQFVTLSFFFGLLLGLSYAVTGDWSFIPAVYGTRLLLPDLTPNVGLWWYFFIEMFDSFRSFFLGVFWLHMASYSPGLTIRLREQPLSAIILLCGIFAVFQPYANIGDAGAFLAMLTLYGHVFELTRYAFPALSTLLYGTLLGPAFYYLWIYAGSGNANFFYAITLVWSLGLLVVLADVLYAILRDEWELGRPEMRGKEVRRI